MFICKGTIFFEMEINVSVAFPSFQSRGGGADPTIETPQQTKS
jgi:hypothetical protein